MKQIDIESIAKNTVGWIFDFKNDNNRLPVSLDDLCTSKSEKHSYSPTRALELNKKIGIEIKYILHDNAGFEVVVNGSEGTVTFLSSTAKYTIEKKY